MCLQIFGRAGRPQFQATGIGFICTTHDKVDHYLSAVTQQQPIESKFSQEARRQHERGDISLGTVTSDTRGCDSGWDTRILFVRMQRNPSELMVSTGTRNPR